MAIVASVESDRRHRWQRHEPPEWMDCRDWDKDAWEDWYDQAGQTCHSCAESKMAPNADPGRRDGGYGDDHYRLVAEIYEEHLADALCEGRRRTPLWAIMETFDVPHTTAARWVRVARERGYMTQVQKGAPGSSVCRGGCSVHCPSPVHAPSPRLPRSVS